MLSKKQNEILIVKLLNIEENISHHMAKLSGFEQMDLEMCREHEDIANHIYEHYFKSASIQILLQPFPKKYVRKKGFYFGKNIEIKCDILERLTLKQDDIISGYLYTFHAPEILEDGKQEYEKLPLLEKYYVENWKIAVLDAGRDWIRNYLLQRNNTDHTHIPYYVTDSFGPGFYGMGIEELPLFFEVLDGESVGVHLNKSKTMEPLKSCIGIYLVTRKDISKLMGKDCINCVGNKLGCVACRN